MFQNQEIAKDIFYVGVNDRQKHKFENMLPLPLGVSYNAYMIIDEKTALIDTVDIAMGDLFIDKIQSQLQGRTLDYLIINHMEPDHSGSIKLIRKYYPEMIIVGNSKTLSMVEGFYGVDNNMLEIKDEEVLSLGKHKLQFHLTPMVHWPETMMTFDQGAKVLFSGDAFGCFGTLDGAVVDTDMNIDRYWDEMTRYYANIVGKYGAAVQKALKKLTPLDFEMICSTHGPIWKEYVSEVVDKYDQYSRYDSEEGVVIVYGSMYGFTELMAETVAQGLSQNGIKTIIIHNVSKSDPSVILQDIFKYRGLIVGSPTYSNELYPEVESLLRKIEIRGVKHRIFGCFGSFTWASAAVKRLNSFVETMKWTKAELSVDEKQGLKEDNYKACLELGRQVAELVKIPIEIPQHCV
ncbi:MAG TPA: FprA family A-type flavoprotein [Paludibacter sp.]|nr:FprA family A-type flavoprotein [Paludibacter sp.]